jgi:hypothetical protein
MLIDRPDRNRRMVPDARCNGCHAPGPDLIDTGSQGSDPDQWIYYCSIDCYDQVRKEPSNR